MPKELSSPPVKPHRVAYGPEREQFGDLYLPQQAGTQEPYPVVLLIHGGYWRARYDLTLMIGLAEDLAARGYSAWNIEYRRVGNPGGGWPGTLMDVGARRRLCAGVGAALSPGCAARCRDWAFSRGASGVLAGSAPAYPRRKPPGWRPQCKGRDKCAARAGWGHQPGGGA